MTEPRTTDRPCFTRADQATLFFWLLASATSSLAVVQAGNHLLGVIVFAACWLSFGAGQATVMHKERASDD